jgi:hypothetical protein
MDLVQLTDPFPWFEVSGTYEGDFTLEILAYHLNLIANFKLDHL